MSGCVVTIQIVNHVSETYNGNKTARHDFVARWSDVLGSNFDDSVVIWANANICWWYCPSADAAPHASDDLLNRTENGTADCGHEKLVHLPYAQ